MGGHKARDRRQVLERPIQLPGCLSWTEGQEVQEELGLEEVTEPSQEREGEEETRLDAEPANSPEVRDEPRAAAVEPENPEPEQAKSSLPGPGTAGQPASLMRDSELGTEGQPASLTRNSELAPGPEVQEEGQDTGARSQPGTTEERQPGGAPEAGGAGLPSPVARRLRPVDLWPEGTDNSNSEPTCSSGSIKGDRKG